ncbi:sulfurtransferase complex subunit TusC [Paraferrimonas haliotis]|uniref:Sulfurtransferase TusC n=1 Tax=Paraferrimonas haliotis TaxID=2013866 RepID=A0AA37TN44_9GAMM|nr:sulfurtransferase complex subunit TusC [Paraferrimonas haliotis]GLS84532.1 sulfurtransferase TusC [Paraferrimonas haliotis]
MKQIAIVFKDPSLGSSRGREALDVALLSASFEQQVSLIFVADGVYQLLDKQQPSLLESKDYIATFKALPFYDIEQVLVCQQAMDERQLTQQELIIDCQLADVPQIQAVLATVDEVIVF